MSAATSHDVADPPRKDVGLHCAGIMVWVDGHPVPVDESGLRTGPVRKALSTGRPAWVQLALPALSPLEQSWFEGSVDPWRDTEAPELDWAGVEGVLEGLGLDASALDRHEQQLLDRMPYLYGRGVARVAREVWGSQSRAPAQLRFFPTVAFHPFDDTELPHFWTVRMTVGVLRNVVVTVRLPDLWWNDDAEEFHYTPAGPLEIANRFFPVADDVTAHDVAEAIGLQQASTARAVSERVRTRLTTIERAWRLEIGGGTRGAHKKDLGDARRVIEITDHLSQLDRQLARLLRRFELDGSRGAGRSLSADIAVRYRFALDELRSLEGNCRLASQAIGQAITTAEQADRERFHFVAAVLASAILVPTLVASIYGANVALPAKDSWRGFIALMLFITAFALIGLFSISKALPQGSMPGTPWLRRVPVRFGASIVAVAAFVGGVLEVM